MESHEVVKACFQDKSPKQIAEEIGVSVSLLYKWSQPVGENQSGAVNPLDRAVQLNDVAPENDVLHWLCQQADGVFIRDPENADAAYRYLPATNEIVRQFAALLSEITQAALDNKITEQEAKAIRQLWEGLKAFTEGFVTACEEGNFTQIRQQQLPHPDPASGIDCR
ncbi:MAG: phage regulatory CII family protein [Verrucomicrobiota bacterium]